MTGLSRLVRRFPVEEFTILPTQKAENSSLARILQWITCVSIASDSNQSQKNELSLFDSDDGGLTPDIPEGISRVDCTIRVFRLFWTVTNLYSIKLL